MKIEDKSFDTVQIINIENNLSVFIEVKLLTPYRAFLKVNEQTDHKTVLRLLEEGKHYKKASALKTLVESLELINYLSWCKKTQ